MEEKYILKEDGICPILKKHCDDECCPVGASCNLSNSEIESPLRAKFMKTDLKYKLSNLLPFIVLGVMFIVGCLTIAYCSETVQKVTWGSIVAIVVGFLVYIRIRNK